MPYDTSPASPKLRDTARELMSRGLLDRSLFNSHIPMEQRLNRLRRVLGDEAMRPDTEFGFPSVEAELEFVTRFREENEGAGVSELAEALMQLLRGSDPDGKERKE